MDGKQAPEFFVIQTSTEKFMLGNTKIMFCILDVFFFGPCFIVHRHSFSCFTSHLIRHAFFIPLLLRRTVIIIHSNFRCYCCDYIRELHVFCCCYYHYRMSELTADWKAAATTTTRKSNFFSRKNDSFFFRCCCCCWLCIAFTFAPHHNSDLLTCHDKLFALVCAIFL